MSRTKNTVRNIASGLINGIIKSFLPFITRTVLIHELGSEYLGLSSLFTSVLQVLNLAELGFSSAITFSMYKSVANNDEVSTCALLNLYRKIYRIIGLIVLFLGLAFAPFLKNLIHGSYPEDTNLYILYFLYLGNAVITYWLFAYKSALVDALQRNDLANTVNTIALITQNILQVATLIIFRNYYLFVAAIIFSTVLNNLLIEYISRKRFPRYVCSGNVSHQMKSDIKKKTYGLMVQKICAATRNSLDSIFISAMLGLNMVGIYNNYYYIISAITGILVIICNNMTASIGNSITCESEEKNYKDMEKFNFIYMWISGWCTTCLLCLYQPFMKLWMGEQYMLSMGAVVCFCIYFYALKMGDIRSSYQSAAGLWYEGRYRAVVEAVLNILLNFLLGKLFGVIGIILATVISILTINFGYGSTIIFKHYFKKQKISEFYKQHLFYAIVTTLISGICYLICSFMPIDGVLELIVKASFCIFVPNMLYFLCYGKSRLYAESAKFIKKIFSNFRRTKRSR